MVTMLLPLKWLSRLAKWPVIGATGLTLLFLAPNLFGAGWGFVGTGEGGWSMANEGGIMPLSRTYHQAQSSYEVGDIVSFDYQGSADPSQNGRSIKRITSVNADGSYTVEGLNDHNSVVPWNAPPESIYGKIVYNDSPVPVSYWRWLSVDWSLKAEQIRKRIPAIVSFRTLKNMMSENGRLENRLQWNRGPIIPAFAVGQICFLSTPEGWSAICGGKVIGDGSGSSLSRLGTDIVVIHDNRELRIVKAGGDSLTLLHSLSPDGGEFWSLKDKAVLFGLAGRWCAVTGDGRLVLTSIGREEHEIPEDRMPWSSWEKVITGAGRNVRPFRILCNADNLLAAEAHFMCTRLPH